jgi:hypothetical protein
VNFPNFPTDNLYKFLALTGLALVVICFLFPFFSLESELRYTSHAMAAHKSLEIDLLTLKESTQKLADRLAQVVQGWQKLKDELSAAPSGNAGLKERRNALESEQKQIDDQGEANKKFSAELEKRQAETEADDRIANEAPDQAEFYRWLCLVGDAVGFSACVAGFWLWYLKLQCHQDEIIALEAKAARKQKPAAARRVSKRPGRLAAVSNSQSAAVLEPQS